MIDVHMLHMENEINIINDFSSPLINIHHADGIPGNTMQARINAFRLGKSPYVSFVDVDDYVETEAFYQCLEVLEQNRNLGGVYTNSKMVKEDGKSSLMFPPHIWNRKWHMARTIPIHQLVVIRRSVLMPILPQLEALDWHNRFTSLAEQIMYTHIATVADWKFIDTIGYHWYKRSGTNHTTTTGQDNLELIALKRKLLT